MLLCFIHINLKPTTSECCSIDEIQWYEMCESTPVNKEQASVCFGDLANAFKVLHSYSKDWTEDDIISVIDELTSK